tara:strand:+ start:113 stop:526 length:414 start_codon:yes stop_codon:yes gene_type:complete
MEKLPHKSFKLVNEFQFHPNPNKLKMKPWGYGKKKKGVRAIYLLVFFGKVIKVGKSEDFFRRMNDYKYKVGRACDHLTPTLNKLIKENNQSIKIYARSYCREALVDDEWGGKTLMAECVSTAERKWKEYHKDTIIFK